MPLDAGVRFRTAETEHGASPTRSATVRRVTTLFLSGNFSPSILFVRTELFSRFGGRRGHRTVGESCCRANQTAELEGFLRLCRKDTSILKQVGSGVQLKIFMGKIRMSRIYFSRCSFKTLGMEKRITSRRITSRSMWKGECEDVASCSYR